MAAWASFGRDLLEQWPLIQAGLGQTLLLAGAVTISGFFLGVVVFYFRQLPLVWVAKVTQSYISFFVGMPLIVLLFLMYYGLPQWGISFSPFAVAFLGFTLNIAAYNAAYLLTAFHGLDPAEIEAARSQGMSELQVFRWVVLPQVLRYSVPALANQAIRNLKDSSVAFLIQYTEFFARVQELASTNFQFFRAYLFAALVYLAMVCLMVLAARWIEKRTMIPGTARS